MLLSQGSHIWWDFNVELFTQLINVLVHDFLPINIDEVCFAMVCVFEGPRIVDIEESLSFGWLLDVPRGK